MIKLDGRGFPMQITEIIQEGTEQAYLDMGFLDIPTPPDWDHIWTGSAWVPESRKTLDDFRADKSVAISIACRSQILSGFESSALGATHHYPAKTTDQQNLTASVMASLLPTITTGWTTPFWCADTNGVWAFRLHTAEQIQQVGQDAKAAILAAMGKNEVLQAQIVAATSIESLDAIEW